jgi:hypothetical protein
VARAKSFHTVYLGIPEKFGERCLDGGTVDEILERGATVIGYGGARL